MPRIRLGLMLLAALAVAPAAAQPVPTREEIQRAASDPTPVPLSRLTVEGGVARAPCPLADRSLAGSTVRLKGVAFDHLAGLPAEALAPAAEAFIGKTVPLATLCEIRDAANAILQRAGYIAAVQVPAQQVGEDGIVHFDVVMARLVRVELRGATGRSRRLLAAYLDRLLQQPLFNEREAERYLLLARDLPGYDIHLLLRPAGTVPGEVMGEVSVTRTPYALAINLQNYGSSSVGRFGALVSGSADDLLGVGDHLQLGLFNTLQVHEQTVLQAAYDVRVGHEGLTLGGRFTYAWTRPDLGGGEHPLKARTEVGTLEASYPFILRQRIELRGAAGVDLIDQDLDYLGMPYTRDRVRVLFGRLRMDASGRGDPRDPLAPPPWQIGAALEWRQSLDILGASGRCGPAPDYPDCPTLPIPSRLAADPNATLLRFSADARYRVLPKLNVALIPRLQYAFKPLVSYEQYSGGAYTVGRGYDPGAIVGDSGAGLAAELRFGDLIPRQPGALSLQPYLFTDAAWTWNRAARGTGLAHDHLIAAGGGIRLGWGERLRADLLVATPLHATALQGERGDTRILLSITGRLTPWRSH